LREDCRPKVFENRVLKRIYGPKRNDLTVEWRKLRDEDLSGLYSSPIMVGKCGIYRGDERCIQGFGGET